VGMRSVKMRRSPVEKYYARVDWGSARDVAKVLRAYGRILLAAPRDESREKLLRALRVHGLGPWVTTTVRTRSRLAIRMPNSTSGGGIAGAGVAIAQPAQRRAADGHDGREWRGRGEGASVWASRTGWPAGNAYGLRSAQAGQSWTMP
jgi:hypothetical protein